MRSHFQFIVTPTADTLGTSLVLHYDDKRYLFGTIAEGTQRAFVQEPGKHFRTQILFLTGKIEWQATGGLIGHMLSLADVMGARAADARAKNPDPDPRLTLFGARNLQHTLATARTFVLRKNMPVDVHEIDCQTSGPVYSDKNVQVWAFTTCPRLREAKSPRKRSFDDMQASSEVSIASVVAGMFGSDWALDKLDEVHLSSATQAKAIFVRKDNKYEPYTGPLDADINVFVRRPWPSSLVKDIPPTTPNPDSVSYIIKSYTKRGKFDVKKAQQLGLLDKSQYKLITQGQSLLNEKGETITPDMVLGPDRPPQCAAVLHVPESEYVQPMLDSLEARQELLEGLGAVVWILGRNVSPSLLRPYMDRTPHIQHIITSPDLNANRLSYDSAAASCMRLQAVDPSRYTSLNYDNAPPTADLPENAQIGDRGTIINFDPKIAIVPEFREPVTPEIALLELQRSTLDLAATAQAQARRDARIKVWADKLDRKDTEVIPLGTGSALPSKYRNVSATLIRVPGWGSLLLDCGENTVGQLRRMFRPDELHGILQDLKLIWISHMHADHHLGTASVIRAWYEAVHDTVPGSRHNPATPKNEIVSQPGVLSVVADWPMTRWLHEYSFVEDYGYSRIAPIVLETGAISTLRWYSPAIDKGNPSGSHYQDRSVIKPSALGLQDLQACPVAHCKGAKAVSITWPSTKPKDRAVLPLKISYSGDCRPSREFARIGYNCTLCIHEATFDDELRGDAIAKQHTTTSEALQVAASMNARAVLLTHFSQRYQKIPVLDFAAGDASQSESVAWEDKPASGDAELDPAASVHEIGPIDAVYHQKASKRAASDIASNPVVDSALADNGTAKNVAIRVPSVNGGHDMKVGVAFDYMRVRIGEFAELEKFTPALIDMFKEEDDQQAAQDVDAEEEGDVDAGRTSRQLLDEGGETLDPAALRRADKKLRRKASKEAHLAKRHAEGYLPPEERPKVG